MDGIWLAIFFAALMLFVGGMFLVVGRTMARRPEREGWWQVPGTIVDWELGEPRHLFAAEHNQGRDIMFPVVEYLLPDGTPHRFRNPTTRDSGRRPRGVPVTVIVDPADPRRAELPATARQARGLGCVLIGVGIPLILAGVLVAGLTAYLSTR